MQTKICNTCHKEKPIVEFRSMHRGIFGVRGECKFCCNKKQKLRRNKNKEKYNLSSKNFRKKAKKLTPWIYIFYDITKRCTNKNAQNYKYYGGRGIKNLFKNSDEIKFLYERDNARSMKKPSIDRKDNDGNYCIENCRFIEQAEHTRQHKIKTILQFDKHGRFIKKWDSLTSASDFYNIHNASIIGSIKRNGLSRGYRWKYQI